MSKLTARQQRFVDEYLIDLNASQAAIRAGYSEKTSRAIASELLTKPNIQEAINAAQAERNQKTKIDAAWVLEQAAQSYIVNSTEYMDEQGRMVPLNANAARGFLELAGKHVGVQAFKEKIETETTLKVDVSDIADAASETEAADAYLQMLRH
jgi:phage terminase small subunit